MPVGSGSANVRHSLTSGFVTLVPTRTGTWNLRSIEYMRTRRSASILVLDVEQERFTPLVFTTTGGVGKYCPRFNCRLAGLIASKKEEQYSLAISWVRAQVSFALLRSALVC